jgi:hypothetical protein
VAHAGRRRRHIPAYVAVLIIRYGHVRYPYREDAEDKSGKPFVRE